MRLAILGQALGTHLYLFISTSAVGPLFILKLGGSDLQAMLPASTAALMALLRIPLSVLVNSGHGKRFMVACWNLVALPASLALLTALWLGPGPLTVKIVLISFFLCQALEHAGSTFWFPLLHDIVPATRRGRFFGNLRSGWQLAYFGASVMAGIFLGLDPALWNFIVVFAVVGSLQIARQFFVGRLPVRPRVGAPVNSWRDDLAYILGNRQLLFLCGYLMLLVSLAGFMSQPLVLYMNHLGFSTRDNTLIYTSQVVGSVLVLVLAGRAIDRLGVRQVFFAVHVLLSGLAILTALVGSLPAAAAKPCLIVILIGAGAGLAAAGLAGTAQLFHLTPSSERVLIMNLMALSATGTAVPPLLTGLVLNSAWSAWSVNLGPLTFGIYQALFLAAGLGLLLAMSLLPFIKNVRVLPQATEVL
ncbi:MAG: hypothetical protein HYV35_04930 [Lentisphaerae bacterium]|nr:hypothetical protein [Lentisphaerota bacterium]